ncbi:hypothetical protein [Streptomyces sp. NPDC059906]|uniref:hypothetical protein n=1 Tax=Streptomyces sp. NPDC059906 TaxID=3346997 RepID=UPI00364655EE
MATPDPTAVKTAAATARTAIEDLITAADAYQTAAGGHCPSTPQVIASVVIDAFGGTIDGVDHDRAGSITVMRTLWYARKNVVRTAHPVVTP